MHVRNVSVFLDVECDTEKEKEGEGKQVILLFGEHLGNF